MELVRREYMRAPFQSGPREPTDARHWLAATAASGAAYPGGPFTTGAVGCQLVTAPPFLNELPGDQNHPPAGK